MPSNRDCLNASATIRGGKIARIPAAAVIPYWTISFEVNSATIILNGFVSIDEARIKGIWYWLQVMRNIMSTTASTIGMQFGKMILMNTPIGPQPSRQADSSNSLGIASI